MASNVMNVNNKKNSKAGKAGNTKTSEIDAYYGKQPSVAMSASSESPQTLRIPDTPPATSTPLVPPEIAIAQLVTDEQIERQFATRNDPPVCRLNEADSGANPTQAELLSMFVKFQNEVKAMTENFEKMATQASQPTPVLQPPPAPRAHRVAPPTHVAQPFLVHSLPPPPLPQYSTQMMVESEEHPGYYMPVTSSFQPAMIASRPANALPYQGVKQIVRMAPSTEQARTVRPTQSAEHARPSRSAEHARPAKTAYPAKTAKPAEHARKARTAENDTDAEYALFDLDLNEECPDGFNCPNSKNPSKCPKNHQKLGNVIKAGAKLPRFFCKWERPWKNGPNGKPLRCRNVDCYFAHLEHRADYIISAMNRSTTASASVETAQTEDEEDTDALE